MDPVTRRSFLIRGSAGAVGVAGIAAGGVALASASDAEPALSADELDALDGPVMVEITDAAAGRVDIFVGEREVAVTDRTLVARVLRATR
jgi:3-hydroxyisobutyrate dehydrogenase-like beta-hydroxyacid dehydrogenase